MSSQKLIPNHSSSTSESTKEKRRRRDCTKTMQVLTLLGVFVIGGLAIWILVRTFQNDAAADCPSCLPPPPLSPQGRPPTSSGEDDGSGSGAQNCKGKTIRVNRNQGAAGIQAAINAACIGDTVLVAPGTYLGCLQIPHTKNGLTLRADGPVGSVKLDATPGNFQCDTTLPWGQNGITAANLDRVKQFYTAALPVWQQWANNDNALLTGPPLGVPVGYFTPFTYASDALALGGATAEFHGGNFASHLDGRCPGDAGFPTSSQRATSVVYGGHTYVYPPINGTAFTQWTRGPHNLTVDGFEIFGAAGRGVYVHAGDSYTLVNNHVYNCGDYGLFPICSSYGVVRNNHVHDVDDAGIYNGDDVGGWVVGNHVHDCHFGVEKEATDNGLIEYNDIHDNTIGIFVQKLPFLARKSSNGHTIRYNRIHGNNRADVSEAGAFGIGIWVLGNQDITIHNNSIYDHRLVGVLGTDHVTFWFTPFCDASTNAALAGGLAGANRLSPVTATAIDRVACPDRDADTGACQCRARNRDKNVLSDELFFLYGIRLFDYPTCIPGSFPPFVFSRLPSCNDNRNLYVRNVVLSSNTMWNNGWNALGTSKYSFLGLELLTSGGDAVGYDVFFSTNNRHHVSVSNPIGEPEVCVDSSNDLRSAKPFGSSLQIHALTQLGGAFTGATDTWPATSDVFATVGVTLDTTILLPLSPAGTCTGVSGGAPVGVASVGVDVRARIAALQAHTFTPADSTTFGASTDESSRKFSFPGDYYNYYSAKNAPAPY